MKQGKQKTPIDARLLERIQILMVKKHVGSVTKWAKELGIPQPTLNKKIRGEENFNTDQLMKILDLYPDVSADWLLRGRGEMQFGSAEMQLEVDEDEIDELKARVALQQAQIEELSKDLQKKIAQIDVLLNEKVTLYNNK